MFVDLSAQYGLYIVETILYVAEVSFILAKVHISVLRG